MAQGRKSNLVIDLTPDEQETLESWQRSTTIPAGLAKRSRVILMLSLGIPITTISRTVNITRKHIYKWAKRFQKKRIAGLSDKFGRGKRPFFPSGGRHSCSQNCL